jgi:hypothetical protein
MAAIPNANASLRELVGGHAVSYEVDQRWMRKSYHC